MKVWKRNAIIATVLLLVCAGVYLNWNQKNKAQPESLVSALDAQQVMGEDTLVISDDIEPAVSALAEQNTETKDYFAQVRLSRQESLDQAVELLEQTIAYDEGTEVGNTASQKLNEIVSNALDEAEIESLVIAKGYTDCVTYMEDGNVCVAVAAPENGLTDTDAACISDIVLSQTDYDLSQLRIIEVPS